MLMFTHERGRAQLAVACTLLLLLHSVQRVNEGVQRSAFESVVQQRSAAVHIYAGNSSSSSC
jgi:hypothetical protein